MLKENIKTTQREEMINITPLVIRAIKTAGFRQGLCVVYIPHTTAGITINENADPDVPDDILMGLKKLAPLSLPFKHIEGNADAHLKSVLTGSSVVVPVVNGTLSLGTWQGIFFCEFDGPRTRHVIVHFISDNIK